MMQGFIYDANDPEARRRKIAQALMRPPQDMGSGIASLGDAVAYRSMQKKGAFPNAPGNNPAAPFGRLLGMFKPQGLY